MQVREVYLQSADSANTETNTNIPEILGDIYIYKLAWLLFINATAHETETDYIDIYKPVPTNGTRNL